jgi:NAD(P)H-dependent flavin oxidoreductase YrpB (nitropropane dioxygenase family)
MDISVIQGGMGVGVSDWRLARAVARHGGLGVVSATALGTVMARRLQDGDPGGDYRRALSACPLPEVAERVLAKWYRREGRAGAPYRQVPMFTVSPTKGLEQLNLLANFAEVWLAKEGHEGMVGVNHLTKILLPVASGLYGAMLAGVDVVIMGAGIPSQVPATLDRLARNEPVALAVDVDGPSTGDPVQLHFDPARYGVTSPLKRPKFLAIVSSVALATFLARDDATRPDGLVVEAPCAGGHNAPPRGALQLDDRGQPVYGPRDAVNTDALQKLGLPFWLAGGQAEPGAVPRAQERGAAGVQIGTAFAYCDESGLSGQLKTAVLDKARRGDVSVFTDPKASPSGYPFKVVELEGTLSDDAKYTERERVCDVGMLRTVVRQDDGRIAYRCPSEPVDAYVRTGGDAADTVGRKCLCNALLADVELGQLRGDDVELPLVTSGDDVRGIVRYLDGEGAGYSAADVIDKVLLLA